MGVIVLWKIQCYPKSNYYLMRHLVQMQVKINGSNMIGIFDAFLFSCYSISSQNIEFCSYVHTQPERNTYEMVIVTVKYSIYTKPLSLAGFTGWFLRYATEPSRLSLFGVELCLSQDSTTHQQASVKHISTSTQLWVSASIMGFKNKVQSDMKKKLRTRNISLRRK